MDRLISGGGAIEPKEFNKIARVFWEHKLFDTMVNISRIRGTSMARAEPKLPNLNMLEKLRKEKDTVSRVGFNSYLTTSVI